VSEKQSEALLNFADALENAALVLKQSIGAKQALWDPSKIKWVQADGAKGPYERYPGEDEKPESTPDYKNMLADLKEHKGKLTRDGYFFWVFTDNATIGRKKRSF